MKKQILTIGKTLNKIEQKQINGGEGICLATNALCNPLSMNRCCLLMKCVFVSPNLGRCSSINPF